VNGAASMVAKPVSELLACGAVEAGSSVQAFVEITTRAVNGSVIYR